MNVWVEPVAWTPTGDEARPIRQLEVKSSSYLGDELVRGAQAVSAIDSPCSYHPPLLLASTKVLELICPFFSGTIHWTVSLLSADDDVVRCKLTAAKDRQFRAYNLPSGVTLEQMAEFWKNLNFSGNVAEAGLADYNPDNFRAASRNVELLRSIARAGKEETERLELEEAGKPKIVLGEPESLSDEEIEAFSDGSLAVVEEPDVDSSLTPIDALPAVAVVDDVDEVTAAWSEDNVGKALDDQHSLDSSLDAGQAEGLSEHDVSTKSEGFTDLATLDNESKSILASSLELAEIHDDKMTLEETQSASFSVNSVEPSPEERPSSTGQLSSVVDLELPSGETTPDDTQSLLRETESELFTVSPIPTPLGEVMPDDVESCPPEIEPELLKVTTDPNTIR